MKTFPDGLQTHLDSGATTLCWCWKLTRADSSVFGFTDHDRDVTFDSVTYEAAAGFTASDLKDTAGLNVDNLEAEGALRSDRLNEADLASGLFDDARVEIWRVNWADASQRVLMRKGSLGEVKRGPLAFQAEVRGLAHYLNQDNGRLFQFACDADLGDVRCKIDLDAGGWRGTGAVIAAFSRARFTASGLSAFPAGRFAGGVLTWSSGANAGRSIEVSSHDLNGSTATLRLWRSQAQAIAPGDGFTVVAGCDKIFDTCRDKFANSVNFRGCPHVPGNDFLVSVAARSDGVVYDGRILKK